MKHLGGVEGEEPSDAIKARTEAALDSAGWQVDVVLSHTCPEGMLPPGRKAAWEQRFGAIDWSTERWLESIRERLAFRRWYVGHYHVDYGVGDFVFLYHQFIPFA